jgi:hypothetical protein
MNHWWSCITKAQQDPHEAAADVYRTEVEGYDGGRDRTKEREKEREKLVYEYFILFFFLLLLLLISHVLVCGTW